MNRNQQITLLAAVDLGLLMVLFPPLGGHWQGDSFSYGLLSRWEPRCFFLNREALGAQFGITALITIGLLLTFSGRFAGRTVLRRRMLRVTWTGVAVGILMLAILPWEYVEGFDSPSGHVLSVWAHRPFFASSSLPLCPDCDYEAVNLTRLAMQLIIVASITGTAAWRITRRNGFADYKGR
jgi:hypothetical protein